VTGDTLGPLVLVVEDEDPVRKVIATSLAANGYRVIEAATGADALRHATAYVPDLVLLDLRLPDMDGTEVARRLREWSSVPILVLSARGLEAQKVAAFEAGADDYVMKPFGFQELLARMKVALRHAARPVAAATDGVFTSGPLRVDLTRRRVHLLGQEVRLTPTEYKLLGVLVQHAGRVVTHAHLMREVWGPRSPEENQYLRVYMTHLRRKLEPDPLHPVLFETEAGVGYRLREDAK
jgi:two-component system KDP operon response regulator KdpE